MVVTPTPIMLGRTKIADIALARIGLRTCARNTQILEFYFRTFNVFEGYLPNQVSQFFILGGNLQFRMRSQELGFILVSPSTFSSLETTPWYATVTHDWLESVEALRNGRDVDFEIYGPLLLGIASSEEPIRFQQWHICNIRLNPRISASGWVKFVLEPAGFGYTLPLRTTITFTGLPGAETNMKNAIKNFRQGNWAGVLADCLQSLGESGPCQKRGRPGEAVSILQEMQ